MRNVLRAVGAVVGIGLIVALALAVRSAESKGGFTRAVAAGTRPAAPELELPALVGTAPVSLRALRGRVVVVNFWASWCDPCSDEAPLLRDLSAALEADGVAFLGIDAKDIADDARAFVTRYGLAYPQGRDAGSVSERWGVSAYPETFVVDRQGRAVAWFPGVITGDELRAAVARAS